jgi:hypothetical protein
MTEVHDFRKLFFRRQVTPYREHFLIHQPALETWDGEHSYN